jgi:F-type H+-transporting ATPase subunit gamma
MFDILSGAPGLRSDFLGRPAKDDGSYHTVVVAVTSDKGLAGGYNANVFRYVNSLCEQVKNPILVLIGSIGYRYFVHSPYLILENFSFKSRLPEVEDAQQITEYLIAQYEWGMFDEIYIVYTHMFSAIKLLPQERHILPVNIDKIREDLSRIDSRKRKFRRFEYLPSEEDVFNALVPMYVRGVIYGCLVEAYAAEQSARITAMDEASKNAEEMLTALNIHYNRVRQAGITQEVSEIISGSAALSE